MCLEWLSGLRLCAFLRLLASFARDGIAGVSGPWSGARVRLRDTLGAVGASTDKRFSRELPTVP